MEITRDKDALKLAGKALENLFREAGNAPILFLSSGGSVLGILGEIDENIFGANFNCGALDERFSADPAINNFLQFKEKLHGVYGINWIDSVPEENDDIKTLTQRMEDGWRNWRRVNPDGEIIITVGMGADGHVAGIMPKSYAGFEDTGWVLGYDAGPTVKYPLRVTVTFEFLRSQVDNAIIYISGEEKRPALERVLADSGNLSETPARIFREMKNVKIFTDIE